MMRKKEELTKMMICHSQYFADAYADEKNYK